MRKISFSAFLIILLAAFTGCSTVLGIVSRSVEMPESSFTGSQTEWPQFNGAGGDIFAGFAKEKITPENRAFLAGYSAVTRKSWGVHSDLWAKCLALEDKNGNDVVIVSLDLIGMLPNDIQKIREKVGKAAPGRILFTFTHTHSAPDTYGIWGATAFGIPLVSGKDPEYMEFLNEKTAACVDNSVKNIGPAKIAFAQKAISVKNLAGAQTDEIDNNLSVMQIRKNDGKVITLSNFAIHPGASVFSLISQDLVYYFASFVEKRTYGEAMFINGAQGGVQPRFIEQKWTKKWREAKRIGERLGKETIDALVNHSVMFADNDIVLKKKYIYPAMQNKNFIKAAKYGFLPEFRDKDGKLETEVNYLRIGGAGIITAPGEVFPNLGLEVRKEMKDKITFFFGLTNAELGYMLTPEDYHSGKYRYAVNVSIGSDIGDQWRKAARDLLKD